MLEYENELRKNKIEYIAGVDEVGRGPLIGDVVCACVIMKPDFFDERIDDSKKISEKKRETLYEVIKQNAIAIGIGRRDSKRIDEINIYEATKEAMYEAIDECSKIVKPEHILIDAMKLENLKIPSTSIIHGDALSFSIACASIVAKVTRDRDMISLDLEYPEYNFKKNKGYGTKEHIEAIKKYGILCSHRISFNPVSLYKEKIR